MKNKPFVRPTASKPWYFTCVVCNRNHYKWGAHVSCYQRWCDECQEAFKSPDELREHALKWHKGNFCESCNMTIKCLKKHSCNHY